MKIIEHKSKWSTYESNVQAYRSNFIASISILLAVGALLIDFGIIYISSVCLLAVIQIWYVWNRVIISRIKIVDFYKFNLDSYFDNKGLYIGNSKNITDSNRLQEITYVKDVKIRKLVHSKMSEHPDWNRKAKFITMRPTRFKLGNR